MKPVFEKAYAGSYDTLYQDKDYGRECDIIERLASRHAEGPLSRLLDLGCGTGNHAFPLAARGYHVTGVERSGDMLAQARQKERGGRGSGSVAFVQGDVRQIRLDGSRFDAALMMFAVLGYQTSNDDVRAALWTARSHLRDGGLLLFDVWYGPAVLTDPPGPRVRVLPAADGEVLRVTTTELDTRHHLCAVRFRLWRMTGDRVVERTEEVHEMRFFFPMEMEALLGEAGFELVDLRAFPEIDQEPGPGTWNVICVARASTGSSSGKGDRK